VSELHQPGRLRCHHCGQSFLGESSSALVFVGMFKDPRERERITAPRDTYRCKSCGWANVFQAPDTAPRHWRDGIELKGAA
jgi:hypothetical protein